MDTATALRLERLRSHSASEVQAVRCDPDARERGLQAQRRDVTYRLEQLAREKQRLQRHLEALGKTA